jgi:hypothetical protein
MVTQATALAPTSQTALTKALGMKGEIVAYHQAATKAAEEAMENLFQCGRLLDAVKGVLKAEKSTTFGRWTEQFCGFSERSAHCYCKLYHDLQHLTKAQRAALFNRHQSQRAVTLFLSESQKTEEKEPPTMTETSLSYELPKPVQTPIKPAAPEPADLTGEPVELKSCPEPAEPETQPRQWPEPWYWDSDYIRDAEDNEVIATGEASSDALNRIVACVNAMAGVPDPGAFMERAGRVKTG